ncbi:RTA1 like protein-domain-containing protein [Gymnopilus junonius]|uniref:RTA1 like protein-domain-containing protein n=1 Tax=Gymnopilus junonius TaxID=109634 RepID=A0A9P5NTA8_GYMJU|nr:RTA1 like protein-domain-containing protein [Gymnopilus junonius]
MSCITATPDKNGHVPVNDCRSLYNYYPSFAAAIVFSIVFGISLCLHTTQAVLWKKRFCWVIIMGVAWETAAFILRIISTRHQISLAFYEPSFLLIFLAPLWFNAFDYMLLGRMICFYLPSRAIFHIPATRLTKLFVFFDVVAFLVQVTGGVMASSGPDESQSAINLGLHIYMGGIGLQQFAILVFTSLAVGLHVELLKMEKEGSLWHRGKEKGWRKLVYTLYASLIFKVLVRIIFRLIEFSPAGNASSIPGHEAFFYCLDSLPMAIAAYLMNIFHPGSILVGPDSEFPTKTRREKKAEKQAKKQAKQQEKQATQARKQAEKSEKQARKAGWGLVQEASVSNEVNAEADFGLGRIGKGGREGDMV